MMKEHEDRNPEEQPQLSEGELIQVASTLQEAAREIEEEVTEIRALFAGPVPPPSLLQDYEGVFPGLADRLVAMAESEGNHRRDQERKALDSEIRLNEQLVFSYTNEVNKGQLFAFIIAIFAFGVGGYVAISGAEIAGSVLGVGGLVGIVTAFIQGRKGKGSQTESTDSAHKDDEEKG